MLNLPEPFEPYRAQIEATVRPYITITTELVTAGPLTDSSFGGYPALPKELPYPADERGEPMALLAQINCAQLPPLAPYPTSGLLQFYIARDSKSYLYGADFDRPTEQKNWRLLYIPDIDGAELHTDFSFLPNDRDLYEATPLSFGRRARNGVRGTRLKLHFGRSELPALTRDYQFRLLLPSPVNPKSRSRTLFDAFGDDDYEMRKLYNEAFYPFGHKIGGYAGFAQDDPRGIEHHDDGYADFVKAIPADPWLLLLQIESDQHIQWGDAGIGNFFIRRSALEQRDFSTVMYTWDCC